MTDKHHCIECLEIKDIELFVKDNNYKDGYSNLCKRCFYDKYSYRRTKEQRQAERKRMAEAKGKRYRTREELLNEWRDKREAKKKRE